MYGRDEQTYYTGRLSAAAGALRDANGALAILAQELRDDGGTPNVLHESRLAVLAARVSLAEAVAALDRAGNALPAVPMGEHVHPFGGDAA